MFEMCYLESLDLLIALNNIGQQQKINVHFKSFKRGNSNDWKKKISKIVKRGFNETLAITTFGREEGLYHDVCFFFKENAIFIKYSYNSGGNISCDSSSSVSHRVKVVAVVVVITAVMIITMKINDNQLIL